MIHVDSNSDIPSPKRPRIDNNLHTHVESSEGQSNEGYQVLGSRNYGKSYVVTLATVSEHESEDESEENNELLIKEMMRKKNDEQNDITVEADINQDKEMSSDGMGDGQNVSPKKDAQGVLEADKEKVREGCGDSMDTRKVASRNEENSMVLRTPVNSVWKNLSMFAPITPFVNKEMVCVDSDLGKTRLGMPPYDNVLSKKEWPPLIQEVEPGDSNSPHLAEVLEYLVQSPEESPMHMAEALEPSHDAVPLHKPLVCGVVEKHVDVQGPRGCFSKKNLDKLSEKVMDRATNICKKRDAQGDVPKSCTDSPNAFSDLEIVSRASRIGVKISYDDFETANLLREMEAARENLSYKINKKCEHPLHIENVVGENTFIFGMVI
jgi:hypothetical protein